MWADRPGWNNFRQEIYSYFWIFPEGHWSLPLLLRNFSLDLTNFLCAPKSRWTDTLNLAILKLIYNCKCLLFQDLIDCVQDQHFIFILDFLPHIVLFPQSFAHLITKLTVITYKSFIKRNSPHDPFLLWFNGLYSIN